MTWKTSIFFLISQIHLVVLDIIVCEFKKSPDFGSKSARYDSFIYTDYETEICKKWIEKCCETGCCSAVPDIPIYVWFIVGTVLIILLVVLGLIIYLLRVIKMSRRRNRRAIVPNVTPPTVGSSAPSRDLSSTGVARPELPPQYSVAISLQTPDKNKLPTYEEATKK